MHRASGPRGASRSAYRRLGALLRCVATAFVVAGLSFASACDGAEALEPVGQDGALAFDPSLDEAQVICVEVDVGDDGRLNVATTVRHDDDGWDHYADAWQIVDPDSDEVLAERILMHPHVEEQPFTRSLRNVELPDDLERFAVRARCSVHAFGGREITVDLRQASGPGFVVRR